VNLQLDGPLMGHGMSHINFNDTSTRGKMMLTHFTTKVYVMCMYHV
jgi:hypothetical protein